MSDDRTLELPGEKFVKLSDVKGLDDEEYQGLLDYAQQWDVSQQGSWVKTIQKARGNTKEGDVNVSLDGSVDYESMTVDELQDELRARDLPVSGTKDELIARLEDS